MSAGVLLIVWLISSYEETVVPLPQQTQGAADALGPLVLPPPQSSGASAATGLVRSLQPSLQASGVATAGTLLPTPMILPGAAFSRGQSMPPPPPSLGVATSPSTLRTKLAAERARLSARFTAAALNSSLLRGAGADFALGARLTAAALSGGPFVVGVTGGSSTAGQNSWPGLLQAWLRTSVGVEGAIVRNAGQGTTSQLVTAPCIRALVGDGVDLLFWEFAMNDEYEYISHDIGPEWPMRHRVAESYIRQAAQLGVGCIGFLHIWDLDIHTYRGGPVLPNKSFAPTNNVMAAYAPVYDRYFALDVIGAMWVSGFNWTNKTAYLRDGHHPNDFGYGVILDLLALSILRPWEAYLDAGGTGATKLPPAGPPGNATAAASVRAHPMMTPWRDDLFLPGAQTLAHCYMAMPPQFSSPNGSVLRAVLSENCTSADPWACIRAVDVGRAVANRDDRQLRFSPGACGPGGASGGVLFIADVRLISAVLVDCGYQKGDYCLGALDLFLDGAHIAPNVAVNDILSAFYKWAHRVDMAAHSDAPSHLLRVCARETNARFSRLAVLEQL